MTPVEEISFGWATVQALITFAIGIYAWIVGNRAATTKEIHELRMQMANLSAQIEHMPDQDVLAELQSAVARIDAKQQANLRVFESMNANLNRINDYLLRKP
ncbi:hypothetical protein D9M71_62740 [compost metagenome]